MLLAKKRVEYPFFGVCATLYLLCSTQLKEAMHTPNFDTDELIQRFIAQGTPENQARAIVRGIVEAQNDLVTKQDMENLEKSIKSDLKDLENRLMVKLPAIIAAILAMAAALQKAYFN